MGEIPPGRAPVHSHTYDEVVLILAGRARTTWRRASPARPRYLRVPAPGPQHCLENTGQATLLVLGVFHPGGSPAAKKPASG